jgi:hypothetical protein
VIHPADRYASIVPVRRPEGPDLPDIMSSSCQFVSERVSTIYAISSCFVCLSLAASAPWLRRLESESINPRAPPDWALAERAHAESVCRQPHRIQPTRYIDSRNFFKYALEALGTANDGPDDVYGDVQSLERCSMRWADERTSTARTETGDISGGHLIQFTILPRRLTQLAQKRHVLQGISRCRLMGSTTRGVSSRFSLLRYGCAYGCIF